MENKPTLQHLRDLYGLNTMQLAQAADVTSDVIYQVLRGMPICNDDAQRILAGLSELTGNCYTLEDVRIEVWDKDMV